MWRFDNVIKCEWAIHFKGMILFKVYLDILFKLR